VDPAPAAGRVVADCGGVDGHAQDARRNHSLRTKSDRKGL
jgi:hypothetical protein